MNSSLQRSSTGTVTFPISPNLALRIHSDTRPHNWKTASLQKGLILLHNGVEVVGEGMGFGVPIAICPNETFFSSQSTLHMHDHENVTVVRKEFDMDTIARNSLWNVTLENRTARNLRRRLDEFYQRHKQLQSLALKRLSVKMNIETDFKKTASAGKIPVDYDISRDHIHIKADFGSLKNESIRKIVMLNEQGSRVFRRYADSDGATLVDHDLGAWSVVTAQWACLTDIDGKFGFRLNRINGVPLHAGREFLQDILDWAGLDYKVDSKASGFEYDVEMLGA